MEHVRAQVAFGLGPRLGGAAEVPRIHRRATRGYGYQVEQDAFDAATPYGRKAMVNLIARRSGGGKPSWHWRAITTPSTTKT